MSKREQEHDTLGNRLKSYEYISTSRQLMPCTPVYARIDGRAFHTFCHGLQKPYSKAFIEVMQETCKFLVEETHASLGYVQSDEISLGWDNITKAPFDGRVQKLESNLASLASAKFIYTILRGIVRGIEDEYDLDTMLAKVDRNPPSFDCRVFNVPSMDELANAFLWRENDAIRNSILGMAYHMFSKQEVFKKNTDELVHMMRMKGYCFYEDTEPAFMRGTFYHRENYLKKLTSEEVSRIPESQRTNLIKEISDGSCSCWRSHIVPMFLPYRLTETEDLDAVLFRGYFPSCKIENPTFTLKRN